MRRWHYDMHRCPATPHTISIWGTQQSGIEAVVAVADLDHVAPFPWIMPDAGKVRLRGVQ